MNLPRVLPPVLLLLLAAVAPAEMRVFKDPLGRKMEAEIVSVEGEVVLLRKPDGTTVRARRESFSRADNEYIANWSEASGDTTPVGDVAITLGRAEDGGVSIEIENRGGDAIPASLLLVRAFTRPPGEEEFGPGDQTIAIPALPPGERAGKNTEPLVPDRDWKGAEGQVGGVLARLVDGDGEVLGEAQMETVDGTLEGATWPEAARSGEGASTATISTPKAGEVVGKKFRVSGETSGVPEGYRCIIAARAAKNGGSYHGMPRTESFAGNRSFREGAIIWNPQEGPGFTLFIYALPEVDAAVIDAWMGDRQGPPPGKSVWAKRIELGSVEIEVE